VNKKIIHSVHSVHFICYIITTSTGITAYLSWCTFIWNKPEFLPESFLSSLEATLLRILQQRQKKLCRSWRSLDSKKKNQKIIREPESDWKFQNLITTKEKLATLYYDLLFFARGGVGEIEMNLHYSNWTIDSQSPWQHRMSENSPKLPHCQQELLCSLGVSDQALLGKWEAL